VGKRLAVTAREPLAAARSLGRLVATTTQRVRLAPTAVVHWPRERAARTAGEASWRAGDEQRAYAHFEDATRDGTNQWSWLRFARSSMRRDRAGLAYDAMARALEIAPASLSVRPEVVNLLSHRGLRDERDALLAAPLRAGRGRRNAGPIPANGTHPVATPAAGSTDYWAWFDYARDAIARDEIETACAATLEGLHVGPSSPSVCLEFASLLNAMGDGDVGLGLLAALQRGFLADGAALIARVLVRNQALGAVRELAARFAVDGRDVAAVVFEAAALHADDRADDARALVASHTDSRAITLGLGHVALDFSEVADAWRDLAPIADFASTRLLLRFVRRLDARGQLVFAKEVSSIAAGRANAGSAALRWDLACDRKLDALAHGLHLSGVTRDETYEPDPKSVFYLLHNSLPYMSAGYASRTHGLLSALVERGRRVQGVTRPGFPYDTLDDPTRPVSDHDAIDDVNYLRIGEPRRYSRVDIVDYFEEYVALLEPLARREQIGLVHAASNFWNGLAANVLRDRLGIPSIYEVRGLWEVTQHSRQPEFGVTEGYQLQVLLEAQAAQEADAVITITHALRHEMARRGVNDDKMIVVPNGVDTDRFRPLPRDEELEADLGLGGKRVIGFVGSLVDYEGLDLLLRAAARLRRTHDDFHVLLVGRGAGDEDLRALTTELGLHDVVTFTGRVPHEQVVRYLSVIDITPFPRHALPVCEMVSPLKPLESMATGKLVVASSVAALAEMVDDGVTGLLFEKESLDDLTRVLGRALDDAELRERLTTTARPWVERERSWAALSGRVEALYEALLSGASVQHAVR
jgi:glycosyltransferase involved in cell wall biosynthesis